MDASTNELATIAKIDSIESDDMVDTITMVETMQVIPTTDEAVAASPPKKPVTATAKPDAGDIATSPAPQPAKSPARPSPVASPTPQSAERPTRPSPTGAPGQPVSHAAKRAVAASPQARTTATNNNKDSVTTVLRASNAGLPLPDDMKAVFLRNPQEPNLLPIHPDARPGAPLPLVSKTHPDDEPTPHLLHISPVRAGTLDVPPLLRANSVLVQVHATAITRIDVRLCARGAPMQQPGDLAAQQPHVIPGHAFSGRVVGMGSPSEGLRLGDFVAGLSDTGRGAWAGYVAVPITNLWRLDARSAPADSAATAAVVVPAVRALQHCRVACGGRIVVVGVATAVGAAALQIGARVFGARMIALVHGEKEASIAKKLKADTIVDASMGRLRATGTLRDVHGVIDTEGRTGDYGLFVRDGGAFVQVVTSMGLREGGSGARARAAVAQRDSGRREVRALIEGDALEDDAVEVTRGVLSTMSLRVPVGPVFGFANYSDAVRAARNGVTSGMVVLMM